MENWLHLLDIDEDIMGRKLAKNKRLVGGMEAPRNSLEHPVGTSYGLCMRDNILYAITQESSSNDYYSSEAPMKKLISQEISKRPNTRQNSPSVVARLMGVDTLPLDSKPAQQPINIKNDTPAGKLIDKEHSKKAPVDHVESGSFGHYIDRYSDQRMKLNKPKSREHPQEEELQKFKKEFEAWQAARFKECSNVVEFTSDPTQLIAQEELNREKLLLYSNSKRTTNSERLREPYKDLAESAGPHELVYSNRMSRTEFSPTKIVILRPGPDRMDITTNEDSWNSSTPTTSEERGRIEDFLEEVKERLKSEIQGKSSKRSTTAIRGRGIETPFREKPPEHREIAQRITQHMNLLRSESTRSYRSEIQSNGADSPEFINRDTRKFLAERLRNVLKGEIRPEVPMLVRNSSRLSMSSDNFRNERENKSWSFRREAYDDDDGGGVRHKEQSPSNLVRSLSAPVSGTSFGKLLLEDRHVLTGAHIRRKHEATEKKVSMNMKKHKKEKFNIREKVSSFRYSLTLRGRLFGRRVKSVDDSGQNQNYMLKDIRSGPTVTMSFYETHENSTEVPPSPASVCSSVHEEFWRQADYLSPISSSSGLHQMEDSEMPHVFREINSNLNELRRKLNQLEGSGTIPEETTINEEQPTEVEVHIEDQTEAYVRDLLIASGLYYGTYSQSMSKWDPLGKPISNHVFEEVEEAYRQRTKNNDNDDDDEVQQCTKDQEEKINHAMILDLLNEALPAILRQPVNLSRFMEKAVGPTHKPPHGRTLLARAWSVVRVYVHPPEDRFYYSLDHMFSRDLETNPWSRLVDDDVNALGRELECLIIGDLIEEIVEGI